jgi:hypothetical protein
VSVASCQQGRSRVIEFLPHPLLKAVRQQRLDPSCNPAESLLLLCNNESAERHSLLKPSRASVRGVLLNSGNYWNS